MSYNKRQLQKDKKELTKAKAPGTPKDIIYDPRGQWAHPGQPTRIPGNQITMQGVPYPVYGVDNTGYGQMMYPGADYTFPGEYVDEYPQLKKGGIPKLVKLPNKKGSKGYSRSLEATNKLFTENKVFDKPKSRKKKVFDPSSKYYQEGGMQTTKSKDGTITNKFINKDGNTVIQVKTKDGRYYEKIVEPQINPLDNTPRYQNALLNNPAVVADNTRVANADFAAEAVLNKPNVDAAVAAEKKAQYEFEKNKWDYYNKQDLVNQIGDRAKAFMVDPLGMASRFVSGEQAYIPGMGDALVNYEDPNRNRYLQAVGYTPGAIEASDIQNMVNPMYWGASIGSNMKRGNYGTAAIEGALTFAPFLPKGSGNLIKQGAGMIADDISKASNHLTTKTPLKNAYKLNPWAFKANPQAYYHRSPDLDNIINKETRTLQGFGESEAGKVYTEAANASTTGINLKKGANNQLYFSKGVPLDGGRYNSTKLGMSGQKYAGPYIVEVTDVPMGKSVKGRPPGAEPRGIESYAVSKRPISLDEAKFYKEHWLKGYKEVPKKLPGSPKYPNGGMLNSSLELQQRQDGGIQEGLYSFSGRPGSEYKYQNGQWYIANKGTNNIYVPMEDPSGNRAKTLMAGIKSGKTKMLGQVPATQNKTRYQNTIPNIAVDNTRVVQDNGLPKDIQEVARRQEAAQRAFEESRRDEIKQGQEYGIGAKTWDVITNPFTAAEYIISGGGLQNMPRNINEMRIAGIDPGVVQGRNLVGNTVNAFTNLVDAGDKVIRNVGKGNYLDAGLEAMRFIPGARLSTGLGKKAGKYLTTQTPLKNAYNLRPSVLKENPEMFLYRARPVGQNLDMNMAAQIRAKEAAGEPLTWYQRNLLNPHTNPEMLAREKYYGQWFEKDPSRLDFYIDPGTRNFADDDAIEILRTKLPKAEANKLNVSQFNDAKILSASPETEFILPKGVIESAERFPKSSWQQLIQEDKAFNTPHWWRGYGSNTPRQFTTRGPIGQNIGTGLTEEDIAKTIQNQVDWITSEEYFKRRSANTGETYDQIQRDVNKTINNAKDAKFDVNAKLSGKIQGEQTPRSLNTFWGPPTVDISSAANNPLMVLEHETGHLYSPAGFSTDDVKLHRGYDNPNVAGLPANKRGVYANYPSLGDKLKDDYLQLGYEQQVRHLNARNQILDKFNLPKDAQLNEDQVRQFVDDWATKMNNRVEGWEAKGSDYKYGKEQDYDDLWDEEFDLIRKQLLEKKYGVDDADFLKNLPEEEKKLFRQEVRRTFEKKLTDVLNKAWVAVPAAIGAGAAATQGESPKQAGQLGPQKFQKGGPVFVTSNKNTPKFIGSGKVKLPEVYKNTGMITIPKVKQEPKKEEVVNKSVPRKPGEPVFVNKNAKPAVIIGNTDKPKVVVSNKSATPFQDIINPFVAQTKETMQAQAKARSKTPFQDIVDPFIAKTKEIAKAQEQSRSKTPFQDILNPIVDKAEKNYKNAIEQNKKPLNPNFFVDPTITGTFEKMSPEELQKYVVNEEEESGVKVQENPKVKKYKGTIAVLDKKLQSAYYNLTNPNLSGNEKLKANARYKELMGKRNDYVTAINKVKAEDVGWFDAWINDNPEIGKPAQKFGLADEPSYMTYDLPKFESYTDLENKKQEEYKQSTRFEELNPNKSQFTRWKFRAAASNDEPLKVQLYGTRGEREKENVNIKTKGAIMHFLDQSPKSGFITKETKNFYKKLKPTDYIGYLKQNEDGTHSLQYKPKKEFTDSNIYNNTFLVRQVKFDDIDFKRKAEDDNFSGHTYPMLKGTNEVALPISSGPDENIYDYSSGQSVVFIFKYNGKLRYQHFAGSRNEIKKEGEDIKKMYNLKDKELTLGLADAGSYSSAISGNLTNNKLNNKDYGYYNRNSYTGAGMAIVTE